MLLIAFNQVLVAQKELCNGRRPSFSPDGKSIAYENNNRIYIMNLATRRQKEVSNLVESAKPRWSPDGQRIIFQSKGHKENPTSVTIWIVNRDGTNLRQLISPLAGC
jgi:Tol biopolymer transport system component